MTSTKSLGSALGMSIVATMILAGNASATIAYDANLANGVYYGTGNPNGGFTVDTETGIEIGLRAKLATINNPVIDSPTDVYGVPLGLKAGSLNHAAWNYDFSIDLASGTYTFGTITSLLTITDMVTGKTLSFDPLTIPDNAKHLTTGEQNSENPLFGGFGAGALATNYDVNRIDTYTFVWTVFNGTTQIATDTIVVNATPEPSTIGLFAVGGLFLVARRRALGFFRQ